MAHLLRPAIVRYGDAAGRRTTKDAPGAKKVRDKASLWYGQGLPNLPPKKRIPLASDKRTALKLLNDLATRAERGLNRFPDKDRLRKPLVELLTDYTHHLRTKTRRPAAGPLAELFADVPAPAVHLLALDDRPRKNAG